MCIIWTRIYTLCGCTCDLATTTCPPELKHQCAGPRMMALDNNKVTCKSCWISKNKRILVPHANLGEDDHDHSTGNNPSPSTTNSSIDSTTESDEFEEETWYDSLEYTCPSADSLSNTNTDSHVYVKTVEHNCPDEQYYENKISTREPSQFSMSQTDGSPEPHSRPSTAYFDFNYPGWLDLVDGVDVSRVCRPVERVYPHYRARPGPDGNLVNVSLGEFVVFGFVDNDIELGQ